MEERAGSAPTFAARRIRLGIAPAHEHERRRGLWAALEAAYPVSFQARGAGQWRGLDAALAFGLGGDELPDGVPCLQMGHEETPAGARRAVALCEDAALARPLRGARLSDAWLGALEPLRVAQDEVVLALLDGSPAWVLRRGRAPRQRVACAPAELRDGEALRERLQAGRCLALLALAQFLRDLSALEGWQQPPTRAAFVIDDPNLHWPTYGHLRYADLSRHARAHGYHLAVAMVPLDGWLTHPRAARLFRESGGALSLCVHGNDHDGPELGRPRSGPESLALVTQVLRRTAAFERRTGLAVDRVMVPPHERLDERTANALRARGFEALCTTRPYPWIATSEAVSWLKGPPQAGALAGWGAAEIVAGGLPMLLRTDFFYPREDHVLRAFLGQPVILYGHHDLFGEGLEILAQAAAEIGRLEDVHWSSLAGIARAGAQTRRVGDALEVRMLARRVHLELPAGVRELRVDAAALLPPPDARLLVRTGEARLPLETAPLDQAPVALTGSGPVELSLSIAERAGDGALPRRRVAPILRRLASEGRDRIQAVL